MEKGDHLLSHRLNKTALQLLILNKSCVIPFFFIGYSKIGEKTPQNYKKLIEKKGVFLKQLSISVSPNLKNIGAWR